MTTTTTGAEPTHPTIAELDRLGDEIAELSVHIEAATARLLDRIREFDAQGGWNTGFRSCAAWLSWRVGLDLGAARERVRVARALGGLPLLQGALARGELSYAKVRALTRVATPDTETRLLAVGQAGTAEHVERIVRGWRRVDRQAEAREAQRQHAFRGLTVRHDDDGTVVVRGRLTAEAGAVVLKALEAAREALYERQRLAAQQRAEAARQAARQEALRAQAARRAEREAAGLDVDEGEAVEPLVGGGSDPAGELPTFPQQQADALVLLAETALHQGLDPGTPGERYQVVVHVEAPVLADADQPGQSVLEDGVRVPAGTSQRLACDASRVVMRHDLDGTVVEIGARTRTIPPALRRALQHRDRGCRFPGCGLPFGQGHHLRHWARGGPTTLSNLTLLCRRHHRAVHEEGFSVERSADGELQFRNPYGWPVPFVPPPPAVPGDPCAALRERNEAEGLVLGPRTALPGWLGERLDVGYAIDVLHPLAQRPAMAVTDPELQASLASSPRRARSLSNRRLSRGNIGGAKRT